MQWPSWGIGQEVQEASWNPFRGIFFKVQISPKYPSLHPYSFPVNCRWSRGADPDSVALRFTNADPWTSVPRFGSWTSRLAWNFRIQKGNCTNPPAVLRPKCKKLATIISRDTGCDSGPDQPPMVSLWVYQTNEKKHKVLYCGMWKWFSSWKKSPILTPTI